ncbi:MAG TPA: hypothetical protein VFU85_09670, partial [Nocardioides sp.]|nr:hypothetical protein [Nocardioides sp.]
MVKSRRPRARRTPRTREGAAHTRKGAATAAPPETPPFEISTRVERQALTRPFQHQPGAPSTRPLRIYTLDPSVSHRIGGVATVGVPYEKVEQGPIGALFAIDTTGAPASLRG